MDFDQMRAIVEVARLRSFSRAAEALGLTQPAISAQVRLVEEETACRLFDRLGRNVYLTPQERRAAPILYTSLLLAKDLYTKGERNADVIRERIMALLKTEPQGKIDYVSIADQQTLEEVKTIDRPVVVSLVVKIGRPRLLDNILLP